MIVNVYCCARIPQYVLYATQNSVLRSRRRLDDIENKMIDCSTFCECCLAFLLILRFDQYCIVSTELHKMGKDFLKIHYMLQKNNVCLVFRSHQIL